MDDDTIHIHPPLLAGVLLIGALLLQHILPSSRGFHAHHHLLGPLLVVAGVSIMLPPVAVFTNRSTTKNPYGEPSELVTSVPFTFTRNPMYLGWVLSLTGVAIWAGSVVMLAAPIAFYFIIDRRVIPREEATMQRLFKEAYVEYKARVRRWI
jgi:protein-S-isoprenylcysteine O-methyltransferase Ste14